MTRAGLGGLRGTVGESSVTAGSARGRFIGILLAVAVAVVMGTPTARADETTVDLGTLPGGVGSAARDINDEGQIVGGSDSSAVLWDEGTITDLGTLGGNGSIAQEMNNATQIVGRSTTASGATHGFLWDAGLMTDLGTLPNSTHSDAFAINNLGQVVGYSDRVRSGNHYPHAFLWEGGEIRDLGTLCCGPEFGSSRAFDINDASQVVGYSQSASGFDHAFLWEDGAMTDLGTLPNSMFSVAYGINDVGQVVGMSSYRAVLWEDGAVHDLGTLGGSQSVAYGINDAGLVVGWSTTASGTRHGFLWEGGVMTDLGALPGGDWSIAYSINDVGLIVGESRVQGGTTHGVLWPDAGGLHDVAVASASVDPTIALVGTRITIVATVENQGNRPETFDVNVFAGSILAGTKTIVGLGPGGFEVVSVSWDTSGVEPGLYEIWIEIPPVPGETDIEDNAYMAGTVLLLPGVPVLPPFPLG